MRKSLFICFLFFTLSCPALAQPVHYVRTIDGDTIVVDIPGWPDLAGKAIPIRFRGCNAPELRAKDPNIRAAAIRAKEYVRALMENASCVEIKEMERGKYFRVVGNVYVDGIDISQRLIDLHYAAPME